MRYSLSALAVAVAMASATTTAPGARGPSPSAATAAFGQILHKRYGEVRGFWSCPRGQAYQGVIDCLGEVHAGPHWHQVYEQARLVKGRVVFGRHLTRTWLRTWSPFGHRYLHSERGSVRGTASVNSPVFDWAFLALAAREASPGHAVRASAFDENGAGLAPIVMFTCVAGGKMVTCRNSLGDAMRYRRG